MFPPSAARGKTRWTGETGRVDDLVRKYADMWDLTPEDTKVYLCGHPGMIENVRGIVRRRGWQEDVDQGGGVLRSPRRIGGT